MAAAAAVEAAAAVAAVAAAAAAAEAAAALGREGAAPWLADFVGPSKVGQRGEVEEAPYARQVSADRPPAAAPRLQAAGCAQVTPEVASIHLLAGAAGAEAGGRGEGGVGE